MHRQRDMQQQNAEEFGRNAKPHSNGSRLYVILWLKKSRTNNKTNWLLSYSKSREKL